MGEDGLSGCFGSSCRVDIPLPLSGQLLVLGTVREWKEETPLRLRQLAHLRFDAKRRLPEASRVGTKGGSSMGRF